MSIKRQYRKRTKLESICQLYMNVSLHDVTELLHNLDTIFNSSTEHHLTMDAFINMLNAHHENFSIDEIHLLFQTVQFRNYH